MQVNYETRQSAPLRINGYRAIRDLLMERGLDVRETTRRSEWDATIGAPKNWRTYLHAQIHTEQDHIGDILGLNDFIFVAYGGFPQQALEAIVKSGYLKRGLTTPPEKKPIETEPNFQ